MQWATRIRTASTLGRRTCSSCSRKSSALARGGVDLAMQCVQARRRFGYSKRNYKLVSKAKSGGSYHVKMCKCEIINLIFIFYQKSTTSSSSITLPFLKSSNCACLAASSFFGSSFFFFFFFANLLAFISKSMYFSFYAERSGADDAFVC